MRLQVLTARSVALIASMGALGNGLAFLSMYLAPLHPQIAIDLSHISTFIVAVHGGVIAGGLTGAIVGFAPFYRFGVMGWFGPVVGSLIIPGKAMTGFMSGLIAKKMRPFIAVVLGYVPESLYTYVFLRYLVNLLMPGQIGGLTDIVIGWILGKAWAEIFIMAFLVEILYRRRILQSFFSVR
jgi:hypothetical protein